MWKLLQKEIIYNYIIESVLVVILLQVLLYTLTPFYDNINLLVLMLLSIVILSTLIDRNKSGIERQNSILPISKYLTGLSRSLLLIGPWFLLIPGLYFVNNFLLPSTLEYSTVLIGELGFVLILITGYVILRDVFIMRSAKGTFYKIFMNSSSFLLLLIITGVLFNLANYIDPKLFTGWGMILIYAWGIVLGLFTTITYSKRKSYLG